MKTRVFNFVFMLGFIPEVLSTTAWSDEVSAQEVMKKNFQTREIANLKYTATLTLTSAKGQTRTRKLTGLCQLQPNGEDSYSIIKISSPAEVKGTGLLIHENAKGDDELWLYTPALGKSHRIAGSDRNGGFVGSEFTYTEMKSPRVEDFTHQFAPRKDKQHHVIISTPVTKKIIKETGYGKKITWVRKDNFVEDKVEFYGPDDKLMKTMISNNICQVDPKNQKFLTLFRTVKNHQSNKESVYAIDDFKVEQSIDAKNFTPRFLERN